MKPTVFGVEGDEFFAKFLAVSLRAGGYTLAGVAPSGEEEALHRRVKSRLSATLGLKS